MVSDSTVQTKQARVQFWCTIKEESQLSKTVFKNVSPFFIKKKKKKKFTFVRMVNRHCY